MGHTHRAVLAAAAAAALASCDGPDANPPPARVPTEVAFVSDRAGNYDIFLLDVATGAVTNLTDHPAMDYGFSWSPDGTRMAFASDRDGNQEIYVMDVPGGATTRLTHHDERDSAPAWSPDGTRIAFMSRRDTGAGEIYIMDADGRDVRRVTTNDRYEEVPWWSPDGAQLAFGALAAASAEAEPTLQIFRLIVATGDEVQLTRLAGHNSAPRWSPDGSQIVFYGQVGEGFAGADIMSIAPDGTGLVNLTNDAEPDWQPDWAPEAPLIVFARGPGDPLDLWTMNADGSDRRPLVVAEGRDEQPQWRPTRR